MMLQVVGCLVVRLSAWGPTGLCCTGGWLLCAPASRSCLALRCKRAATPCVICCACLAAHLWHPSLTACVAQCLCLVARSANGWGVLGGWQLPANTPRTQMWPHGCIRPQAGQLLWCCCACMCVVFWGEGGQGGCQLPSPSGGVHSVGSPSILCVGGFLTVHRQWLRL